jgi:hypothetical protein
MVSGLLIGILFFVLILLSGWIRVFLNFISFGIIGNRIPLLYLLLGFSFGADNYADINFNYWSALITNTLLTVLLIYKTTDFERIPGEYSNSTVIQCSSGFLIGSFLGLIVYLI